MSDTPLIDEAVNIGGWAYIASVARQIERDLAAAHSRNEQWMAAMRDVGQAVNCLYSVFPDANGHIVSAIEKVKADLAAAQADNERLYGWIKTKDGQIATVEADWKKAETELAAAQAEVQVLQDALCMIYDKYEDGPACSEGFDGEGGYIGNAVMLSKEEEDSILALIPKERDAAIDQARKEGV